MSVALSQLCERGVLSGSWDVVAAATWLVLRSLSPADPLIPRSRMVGVLTASSATTDCRTL